MLATFQLYGPGHLLTLLFLTLSTLLLIRLFRKDPLSRGSKSATTLLAFLCFACFPLNQAAVAALGGTRELTDILPFHLCDLAAFICGVALMTRRPLLCELSYFWGLAGTLQGVITPDLNVEFPAPSYISFFLQHGVIVITAFVLPLGLGWRPRPHAALRCYLCLLVYAVTIYGVNLLLQTNFGFVIEKPQGASLLDVLGPWPWYIIWTLSIAAVIFYILSLPFKSSHQVNEN